jgi:hypothetical protein
MNFPVAPASKPATVPASVNRVGASDRSAQNSAKKIGADKITMLRAQT